MEFNKRNLIGIIHASVWVILFFFAFGAIINLYEPLVALVHSVSNIALVMLLFYSHLQLVNRFLEKKRYGVFLLLSALFFTLVLVGRVSINLYLFQKTDILPVQSFIKPIVSVGVLVFLTSGFIWLFAIAYQLLMNRFKKERQTLALINQQQAAQLTYLKAQINPHFLFNALNNIYSLTVAKSNDAPKMLLTLSDLLRYAIYDGQRESVFLRKEVDNIEKFIALFQMKSEHPLPVFFDKQGNWDKMSIEPMILIPLVENCFKHCDFETNPHAFIHISLQTKDNTLFFTTKNTYNATDTQKDAVGGVGLENIKQRLAMRYNGLFELFFDKKETVFEVFLKIKL